jgi:uncharacterized protein YbjT (DUF2867 family)
MIGGHVIAALRRRALEPVVLSPADGVDTVSGRGVADAVAGVDAVIDVSGPGRSWGSSTIVFFTRGTEHLVSAGLRAGVRHHVALSIVGCDRVPAAYYEAKRRQEDRVLSDGVPGTVLRSTQCHEFAGQILDRARRPIAIVPVMRVQPIAAREIAEMLVALALGPPAGRAPELAGPNEEDLPSMVRRLARRRRLRRPVLGVRVPGSAGHAVASGALLPREPGPRGTQDFEAWLATETYSRAQAASSRPGERDGWGSPTRRRL